MLFLWDKFITFIFAYIRPFIKWFLHTFTKLCELQRICYGAQPGASRTKKVERSLVLSKKPEIQQLIHEFNEIVEHCNEDELKKLPFRAISIVQRVKNINARIHPDFSTLFGVSVLQIWSYKHLMHQVEILRSESYDSNNKQHEQKLLELWHRLMPTQALENRISRQWQEIGFQGDDPKTDFRGMGMLGLENLLFFAHEYNEAAQHVLLHSRHPTLGLLFAIVSINITAMAYRLLKSGDAKTHFYNVAHRNKQPCTLEQFHKFYCYLFFEFDRFWFESKANDIMDFHEIFRNFEITILEALHNDCTIFKTNLVVEDV